MSLIGVMSIVGALITLPR